MLEWLVEWWDGVELWLVQLPYPPLVTLVLAVLLPVAWVLAGWVNRGIDWAVALMFRNRDTEPPLGREETSGSGRFTGSHGG